MATTDAKVLRRTWPIVYGRRTEPARGGRVGLAWALFLLLGLPFVLMTVLTVLARAGTYVDLFRPLWQPWPPDLLKPFLGVAVFAATLAYLAYRIGHRSGFRAGAGAGMASVRNSAEVPTRGKETAAIPAEVPAPPVPPPPPEDVPAESL